MRLLLPFGRWAWQSSLVLFAAVTLLQSNADAQAVNPALDGKIVYWSDIRTGTTDAIYSVNPDGSAATKLFDKHIDHQHYAISADGNVFAYWKGEGTGKDLKLDIWTSSADGKTETKLTSDGRWNSYPSLDAQGRKVAFVAHSDGTSQAYVINTDGSGRTKLTQSPLHVAGSPVLSPQGDVVIVNASRLEWDRDAQKWHVMWTLFWVTTDGKDGGPLTETRDSLEGTDSSSAFSPDGQRVVFISKRDGVMPDATTEHWNSDIYIVNRDGSEETRLTNLKSFCAAPSFSPDGSQIVFLKKEKDKPNAKWEIWTMKADGSDPRLVVKGETDCGKPFWIGLPKKQ